MMNPTVLAISATILASSVLGDYDYYCPRPKVPSYGYIAKGYQRTYEVGSVVVYACKSGYKLWGQSRIKCLRWGKIEYWNADPPVCKKCKLEEIEFM